jgi:hypothetical protein
MARRPRLEFSGAIYHINHRRNHQESIKLKELVNGNKNGSHPLGSDLPPLHKASGFALQALP